MVLMIVKSEIFRSREIVILAIICRKAKTPLRKFLVKPLVLSANRACALDEKLRRCQQ